MYIIGITGHRPNKLGGYTWNNPKNKQLRKQIKYMLKAIILNRYLIYNEKEFLVESGMALGVDMYSVQAIIELQMELEEEYPEIKLMYECAIPCKSQTDNWLSKDDIKRYNMYIDEADIVTYVDTVPDYMIKGLKPDIHHNLKLDKRNHYMVDKSDIILAIWNGSKGGTRNCINYALSKGKTIIRIDTSGRFIETM